MVLGVHVNLQGSVHQRSQKLRNSSLTPKNELISWILAFLRLSPLFLAPHGNSSTPPGFLAPHSRTTSACQFSPARNFNFSGSAFERCSQEFPHFRTKTKETLRNDHFPAFKSLYTHILLFIRFCVGIKRDMLWDWRRCRRNDWFHPWKPPLWAQASLSAELPKGTCGKPTACSIKAWCSQPSPNAPCLCELHGMYIYNYIYNIPGYTWTLHGCMFSAVWRNNTNRSLSPSKTSVSMFLQRLPN